MFAEGRHIAEKRVRMEEGIFSPQKANHTHVNLSFHSVSWQKVFLCYPDCNFPAQLAADLLTPTVPSCHIPVWLSSLSWGGGAQGSWPLELVGPILIFLLPLSCTLFKNIRPVSLSIFIFLLRYFSGSNERGESQPKSLNNLLIYLTELLWGLNEFVYFSTQWSRLSPHWMLVIRFMNTLFSLCSTNKTSVGHHCRPTNAHSRVQGPPPSPQACEEEEGKGMPVTFQDFYLEQPLSLSLWGFSPGSFVLCFRALFSLPFVLLLLLWGGRVALFTGVAITMVTWYFDTGMKQFWRKKRSLIFQLWHVDVWESKSLPHIL